ncbi:MAG: hypothetical protein MJ228_02530 [Bacilli bacterium]|nr:hypothetical protein [Bacilli bacterium]
MKKKILFSISAVAISSIALSSCSLSGFFDLLDSLTISQSIDKTRGEVGAGLSYIEEGENFKASETKYVYEDIHDSSSNYPFRSTGDMKLLVIPVEISGFHSIATEENRAKIEKAFFGESSDTEWQSVSSFYEKSSYGGLHIKGTVSKWYQCGMNPNQILSQTARPGTSSTASGAFDPTWNILEDAITWYKSEYNTNLAEYDNDKDGYIDGVWLIYGCPDGKTDPSYDRKTFWAYNYKDYYMAGKSNALSPNPFNYCWASYDFMYTGYGNNKIDSHTYIHETGHLLGLDDYYVADRVNGEKNYGPMGGLDMMDYNVIDHNAWSKFALGWTKPYVVSGSTTITLDSSVKTGQAIILPTSDGWHDNAFDEYVMMEFYTPDGLNFKDSFEGYSSYPNGFTNSGVRIYHVDARMAVSKGGTASAQYANEFTPSQRDLAIIPQSNSSAYNQKNASKYLRPSSVPDNFLKYRLIQQMDASLKRNFDTEKQNVQGQTLGLYADNSSLFKSGDTFDFETYKNSFPNYVYGSQSTMNNGATFPWRVTFSNLTENNITVNITKI